MDIPWKTILVVFVIATIVTLYIVNQTVPAAYDFGACTFNVYECDYEIECTDDIVDECCMDIRLCGGSTTVPEYCYTQYCPEEGKMCVPEYNVAGGYDCICKSAYN